MRDGSELTAKVRLGEPELVQEAASRALGLRVFRDRRAALTYTRDLRPRALEALRRRVGRARQARRARRANALPPIRRCSRRRCPSSISGRSGGRRGRRHGRARTLQARARRRRAGSRRKVTNSEGATWSRVLGATAFATTDGFAGGYRGSYQSLVVEPLCDDADRQEAQRLLVDRRSLLVTSTRSRGGRPRGRAPHGRHARLARRSTPASCRSCSIRRRAGARCARSSRHLGRRVLAQVELPRRPRGHAGRVAARHDRRRSADPARPRLAPVRRRRAGVAQERRRRRRRLEDRISSTSTRRASSAARRPAAPGAASAARRT